MFKDSYKSLSSSGSLGLVWIPHIVTLVCVKTQNMSSRSPTIYNLPSAVLQKKKFTRELRKLSIQWSKINYIQIKVVKYLQRINFSVIQFYISKYRKLDELSLYKWQTILYKTKKLLFQLDWYVFEVSRCDASENRFYNYMY